MRVLGQVVILAALCLLSAHANAHGDKHIDSPLPDGGAVYSEEVDGMQALFALENIERVQQQENVLFACDIRVGLAVAEESAPAEIIDVALRYTSDHKQLGQVYALILDPDLGQYGKKIFLHDSGEKHFLLIVIDAKGIKREFHFHHSF